jgi:hypothetical protein
MQCGVKKQYEYSSELIICGICVGEVVDHVHGEMVQSLRCVDVYNGRSVCTAVSYSVICSNNNSSSSNDNDLLHNYSYKQ